MDVTINIDAGGTFTDGFFTVGDRTETAKVPTTEHDLTVCFIDCIERGADKLDRSVPDLLSAANMVRFSTTVGTNTVIEKTGPKVGLLVTAGHETDLYAADRPSVRDGFVESEMIAGIAESVSPDGEVMERPDPEAVTAAVKQLQERGARHIAVAFEHAYANPANERRVKEIIEDAYPRHYLGALPTTASYEVTARPDEHRRLNTLVINAYIHRPMKSALYRAEDKVRADGYTRPLFIGHSNAGVARVAKSIAINTHNSGPAAGVLGVQALSELYDEDMVAADMGGTSIDLSVVTDGEYSLQLTPTIDSLETAIPAIGTHNLGAGGGSIATADGALSVGPESAGANPGPACFGRGGSDATVTDADLVRGILDPDYFLGGTYQLDTERAHEAIVADVADPLGIQPAEAARRVGEDVQETIAAGIRDLATDVDTIVAFGGAGGVHAAGFAANLDIDRVLITPYSSVFSAFGESMMDVKHTYAAYLPEVTETMATERLQELLAEAQRDMRAEGFDPESIDVRADTLVPERDHYLVQSLDFDIEDGLATLPAHNGGQCLRLHAMGHAPKAHFEEQEFSDEDPGHARKGERPVYWRDQFTPTPIYQNEDLEANNTVAGPAVIEAVDTTISVPPAWRYRIDRYGHGVLERL